MLKHAGAARAPRSGRPLRRRTSVELGQRRRPQPSAGARARAGRHPRARRDLSAASSRRRAAARGRLRGPRAGSRWRRRMSVRVLIVDDQELVRGGLAHDPRGEADIEVVGEAATASDALDGARRLRAGRRADGRPHARDGRARGDAAIARRRAGRRGCSCSRRSTSTSTSTRRCGPAPAGSCSRTRRPTSWSTAIRVVASGDALLGAFGHPPTDRRVRRRPAARRRTRRRARRARPTREHEVLRLLARGLTNAEIAARAGRRRGDGQDPRRPGADEARPA